MTAPFTESDVEEAALSWLKESGWTIRHGAEMIPGELFAERDDYGQVVLAGRLRDALATSIRTSHPKHWMMPFTG